jgi:NADH:ubiquinone oxidoreductase subunit 6 (subunit J)
MTTLFIYVGGAGVLGAALVVLGLVISSDISILGKGAVLVLCLAVAAFTGFTVAAYQTGHTSSPRNYRRPAMICWCLGAAAIAFLIAAALMGLL